MSNLEHVPNAQSMKGLTESMNKTEYQALTVAEQVAWINSQIETGERGSKARACELVGLVSNNLNRNLGVLGYKKVGNIYVLTEQPATTEPFQQMELSTTTGEMFSDSIWNELSEDTEQREAASVEPTAVEPPQPTTAQETIESEEVTIMPENENKPTEGKPANTEQTKQPKRMGRPPRTGDELKKMSIEVTQESYKALQHYKINEGITLNRWFDELIKANVPEKYFDI